MTANEEAKLRAYLHMSKADFEAWYLGRYTTPEGEATYKATLAEAEAFNRGFREGLLAAQATKTKRSKAKSPGLYEPVHGGLVVSTLALLDYNPGR